MKKHARLGQSLFLKNLKRLVMRLADMKCHGKPRFVGKAKLTTEDVALNVARRQVVVVIKADLADGAHTRVGKTLKQRSLERFVVMAGVMRMAANRQAHARRTKFANAGTLRDERRQVVPFREMA